MVFGINILISYIVFLFVSVFLLVLNWRLKKITKDRGFVILGWTFSIAATTVYGLIAVPLHFIKNILFDVEGMFIYWSLFLIASLIFTTLGWRQIVKKFGSPITLEELKQGKKEKTAAKKISEEIEATSREVQARMQHKIH